MVAREGPLPGPACWPALKVRCGQQVGAGPFQPCGDEVQPLAQLSEPLLLTTGLGLWEVCSPNLLLWSRTGCPAARSHGEARMEVSRTSPCAWHGGAGLEPLTLQLPQLSAPGCRAFRNWEPKAPSPTLFPPLEGRARAGGRRARFTSQSPGWKVAQLSLLLGSALVHSLFNCLWILAEVSWGPGSVLGTGHWCLSSGIGTQ